MNPSGQPKPTDRIAGVAGLKSCAAFGLLVALVLACYWPALRGGELWDDAAHITRPDLRGWIGLARIWTAPGETQQYYPVLHSAFWVEHRLWGDATLGYHLANALEHAAACLLLALILRRLRPAVPPGAEWIAAALFAVHPVCVESVAWISEQKNTLSLDFYLLAGLAYLNFHRTRQIAPYLAASACFILALGTKSVTATLPAAVLVVLWWTRGALDWRRDIVPLLPWFGLAVAAGTVTAWIERTIIGAQGAEFSLLPVQRLFLAGRIVWFYLGKLVWPTDLMFIYPRWNAAGAGLAWSGWLAGVLAITVGCAALRRRTRGPLAAWLFFVGSLAPALGFVDVYPFRFSYVADHFQYLPALGIVVLAAGGFARWLGGLTGPVRFAAAALGWAILTALAALAHQASRPYRNSAALYRATLERNPACWMAHNNLGAELAKSPDELPRALAHYREALRLKPDYAEAHNNLGYALARMPGGATEAIAQFAAALRTEPGFIEARLNLANTLAQDPARLEAALAQYAEVLRRDPANAEAHFCAANALATRPDHRSDALAEFAQALRLRPDYAEAQANLAGVLAMLPGRLDEALAHYEESLRLDPNLARTHYSLAVVLERLGGRTAAAQREYEEALRLDPDYAKAHNNLAILYAEQGNLALARRHWQAALRLKPDYADARRNLDLLDRRRPAP